MNLRGPRLLLLALLLAALPVGLALLIGREPDPSARPAPAATPTQVSLELKRPSGDTRLVGCAITHHYAVYAAGATIAFRGEVADPPRAAWRVRVKLKSCVANAFRPAGDVPVAMRSRGRFRGSFPAPVPGLYFARASVTVAGRQTTRSYKRFFLIR